jgi:hypothetical protein
MVISWDNVAPTTPPPHIFIIYWGVQKQQKNCLMTENWVFVFFKSKANAVVMILDPNAVSGYRNHWLWRKLLEEIRIIQ